LQLVKTVACVLILLIQLFLGLLVSCWLQVLCAVTTWSPCGAPLSHAHPPTLPSWHGLGWGHCIRAAILCKVANSPLMCTYRPSASFAWLRCTLVACMPPIWRGISIRANTCIQVTMIN